MARRVTRDGRTISRRRDGVIAVRRAGRWRRAAVLAVEGALLLVPLVFALAFVLPVPLLPIPPVALGLGAWLLFRSGGAAEPQPERARVIAMRPRRARRGGRGR